MKTILTLVWALSMTFVVTTSYATTHNVSVTDGGFIPVSFSAIVGDTVLWTTSASNQFTNNTYSTSVPGNAATWNSGNMGPSPVVSFMYVITVPGTYDYAMNAWDMHTASFTATASGPANTSTFHNITITDSNFSPDTLTAHVGDTILWTAAAGNVNVNNTASTTIPTAALFWSSGGLTHGQNFMYVITTPGVYNYQSDSATNFTASFTVPGTVSSTHLVVVTDYTYIPDNFIAAIGDTITWLAAATNLWTDNSASDTVPSGAATWTSGGLNPGQSFSYVITESGYYAYQSDSFFSFSGSFTVPFGAGINTVNSPSNQLVFQNPFINQLDFISSLPGLVTIYDILGNKVANVPIEFAGRPAEINMTGMNSGIYLIAFSSEGKLVQTYKAIKID